MVNKVIISIGSNINPNYHIQKGLDLLGEIVVIKVVTPLVETQPIGITNQEIFTNGALLAETHLSQSQLKAQLKAIEDRVGRDRSRPKFGPREIDFDIICWNEQVVDDDYFTRSFLQDMVKWIKTHETSHE
jgi:2-amino-4-hydroxy-6-hydroxymethyldihydropteridine diphosphokinase